MNTQNVFKGGCFCGAVKFTLSGTPALQGYCHCESCRSWSASPINAFTLWNPEALKVTHGDDKIVSFEKTPASQRHFCRQCGGHLFTQHPEISLTDVYAATIPDFDFNPELHVHYQESTLHIHDGLPKMKDLPAEANGSGIQLPE